MIARSVFLILCAALPCCLAKDGGCRRSDPGLNSCVVSKLNSLRGAIKKGFPEMKVGPLDPLYVPRIKLRQGSGPVSIDLTATDQVFRGIANYQITAANIDLQNYKMEFSVALPWLFVEGKSKIEGKILVLPIHGNGDGWSNYTMVSGKAVLKGHPTQKNSKEHFSLDSVDFDMSVKRATIIMNGLFNGNKELGDAMNKFMSENWEVVFQELKPVIDQTVEALMQEVASKVFAHYSLDDMFPK